MSRGMGPNQIEALQCLNRHGSYPGGWVWDNHSTTVRLLESLVRRGFVEAYEVESRLTQKSLTCYRITDNGRVALAILRTRRI